MLGVTILADMDTATLPRHAYHHLMYTLRRDLPPASSDPGAAIARDYAAIAQVSALCPANAAEAAMAALAVAGMAQATATMGWANDPATEPGRAVQCVAQVASLMRQAQGAIRTLLAMQAERRRREGEGASAESAAWIEYGAAQWMAEALSVPPGAAADISESDTIGQNTGHCSHIHAHETESGSLTSVLSGMEGAGSSQTKKHDLVDQIHETKTAIRSDATPDAEIREQSHGMKLDLMSQSHETEPPVRSASPRDAKPVGESQSMKRDLMLQSHETESARAPSIPQTRRPPNSLRT